MRNSHPSPCYRCGLLVLAKHGHFERTSQKVHGKKWPGRDLPKWLVQHAVCAVKYRGTDVHYLYNPVGAA